jgi:hypothetical protein
MGQGCIGLYMLFSGMARQRPETPGPPDSRGGCPYTCCPYSGCSYMS